MDEIKELEEIIKSIGAQHIWHPVMVNGDKLLANGIGESIDGIRDSDGVLKFDGKTVVDLGCNFGHYSFVVRNAGARYVLGIDFDERIIRGWIMSSTGSRPPGRCASFQGQTIRKGPNRPCILLKKIRQRKDKT